ncbi:MAG: ABC transporter ATP-binding protein/permease [Hyphomicrobiaceae bacterium]|nr:MAG: ABC transporter ATP-binding protein/permease [Hyphomicrobiaceae bacterium]
MKHDLHRRVVSLLRQLRDAWQLAGPYFRSRSAVTVDLGWLGRWTITERWIGCFLLCSIIAFETGQVWLTVLLNEWNARFFNALQDKNILAFWKELAVFTLIAGAFVAVAAYQLYLTQWLHMRWRAWMTTRYLDRWLQHGVHYRMRLRGEPADNPDQRIADDIEMFVDRTLSLGIGFLSATMILVSFVVILWGLSAHLSFPIGSHSITVPGSLVWMAVVFAFLGTLGAHRIGQRLISLNFAKQRFEADFRYALVRLRENSEQIALARGESRERDLLSGRFANVVSNWYASMSRQKRLTFFTTGYNQIAVVLPTIIVAPHYFAGLVSLGTLTQTGGAFGQVQTALSFFVNAYARFAQWKSVIDRLVGFETQIALAADLAHSGLRETRHGRIEAPLAIDDVDVQLPDGTHLVTGASFTVRCGEAILLTGPSGSGKSSLFRAVAAIWPYARGRLTLATGARLLILSQRPYFPLGSLRAALAYPASGNELPPGQMCAALEKVGLAYLAGRSSEIAPWNEVLSPGEQQRLAFCRVLVHRPDVVLLDEATSALDEPSEAELYRLLRLELPSAAIVSIGHRSTLAPLHDRSIRCGWLSPRVVHSAAAA